MATKHYAPRATPIQQVATFTVTDVTNTHTVILSLAHESGTGSAVSICTSTADGVYTTTTFATAIVTAFNAVNHTYVKGTNGIGGVTAASTGAVVTFTANTAGTPFIITKTGTSTDSMVATTANSGPKDLSVAGNFVEGVVMAASDHFIAENIPNLEILYGLNQTASFTGGFTVVNCNGVIGSPGANLTIAPSSVMWDTNCLGYVDIGSAAISPRIVRTSQAQPYGLYLIGSAIATCRIEEAASVAIAFPTGETATVTTIENLGRTCVGQGCTATNVKNQENGSVEIRNSTTVALIENNSDTGDIIDYGTGARTVVTNNGFANIHIRLLAPGSTRVIGTLNGYDGAIDFSGSRVLQTISASSRHRACQFFGDNSLLTFTVATVEFGSSSRTARAPGGLRVGGGGGFGSR